MAERILRILFQRKGRAKKGGMFQKQEPKNPDNPTAVLHQPGWPSPSISASDQQGSLNTETTGLRGFPAPTPHPSEMRPENGKNRRNARVGHPSPSPLPQCPPPRTGVPGENGDRGRSERPPARDPAPRPPDAPKDSDRDPGPPAPAAPGPAPPAGPLSAARTAAAPEVDPRPASLAHTPHTKAPRPPPSRPHSPVEQSMRRPAPASPRCTPD